MYVSSWVCTDFYDYPNVCFYYFQNVVYFSSNGSNNQHKKKSILKQSSPKVTPHSCDSHHKKCHNRMCKSANQIVSVSTQHKTEEPNSLLIDYDSPTTLSKLIKALSHPITCIDFGID
jgi:hypothetical protein